MYDRDKEDGKPVNYHTMHARVRQYFEKIQRIENREAQAEYAKRFGAGGQASNVAAATAAKKGGKGKKSKKDKDQLLQKQLAQQQQVQQVIPAAPAVAALTQLPAPPVAAFTRPRSGSQSKKDTPCKFFASGQCRKGKACEFSHKKDGSRSPSRSLSQAQREARKTQFCIPFLQGRCSSPCKDGRLHQQPVGADKEKIDRIMANGPGQKMCRNGRNCTYKKCTYRHPTASAVRKMRKRALPGRTNSGRYLTRGGTRWKSTGSHKTPRGTSHKRTGSANFPDGRRRSRGGRQYSRGGTRARTPSRSPGGTKRIGAAKNH